jgi:DNA-binding transcriptional ArsR family regulator
MQLIEKTNDLHIDALQLTKTALVYRAINHPLRQQILQLLHTNLKMIVTDIYHKLQLEQSVASQHLAILRRAGFVNTKREGKNIFYSVNYHRLKEVHQNAEELLSRKPS